VAAPIQSGVVETEPIAEMAQIGQDAHDAVLDGFAVGAIGLVMLANFEMQKLVDFARSLFGTQRFFGVVPVAS
jgi:hypothetical protein